MGGLSGTDNLGLFPSQTAPPFHGHLIVKYVQPDRNY